MDCKFLLAILYCLWKMLSVGKLARNKWKCSFNFFVTSYESIIISNHEVKNKPVWRRIWAGVEEVNLCVAFSPNAAFLFPITLFDLHILCFSFVQQNASPNSLNYHKHSEICGKNVTVCIHLKDHDYILQLPDSNIITAIYLYSFRNKSHRGAVN